MTFIQPSATEYILSQEATNEGFESTLAKQEALAFYLECESEDLDGCEDDITHYGLTTFDGRNAIGTDKECDRAAKECISGLIWAFSSSFILEECGLPYELKEGLTMWKEQQCENCNDELYRMIDKLCGIDEFVQSAICYDSRGHFLGIYDGNENEIRVVDTDGNYCTYYIYRIN